MQKTNREGTLKGKPSVPSLLVFCETKQAASDGDLFLYGAAIISHRISLSRVVVMCEANDAEMSEEASSFDLPLGILSYYCSAMQSRCASRGPMHSKKHPRRRKQEHQSSPTGRKKRKDTSVPRLTSRDELALTWIGQQYAMRLDQIQELLGQLAGHGAAHEDAISESATLNVIARWKQAGWVMAHQEGPQTRQTFLSVSKSRQRE